MSEHALKPCYICASTNLVAFRYHDPEGLDLDYWCVGCNDCENEGPQAYTEQKAVEEWNIRCGIHERADIRLCPFCKEEEAHLFEQCSYHDLEGTRFTIWNIECYCGARSKMCESPEETVALWNAVAEAIDNG